MSGDFKIGYAGDKTGIDPDAMPYLKLNGRGYCRWYKGLAATTSGVAAGDDPGDGIGLCGCWRAAPTTARVRKTLIISNMIFEGDLATTMKQLGDDSRLIALNFYERVEIIDVEGRWSSQMLFTFNDCNMVRASRIYLHHGARDGFNVSNSVDVAASTPTSNGSSTTASPPTSTPATPTISASSAPALFVGNRVYNCQGVKLLGGKNVLISGNSFRAPFNYAVYVGDDDSFGAGRAADRGRADLRQQHHRPGRPPTSTWQRQ